MPECRCVIRRIALVEGEYIPVIAPVACNYFGLLDCGPAPVMRSSDPSNPDAEYQLNIHGGCGLVGQSHTLYRFQVGETVTYLKSTSGVGPAIVEFIL